MLDRRVYVITARPVSVNEAYPKRRGSKGRFLSHKAADFKVIVRESLEVQDACAYKGEKFILDNYEIEATLFLPRSVLYRLDGGRKKTVDCTNYTKILEDAIFEYLFPEEKSADYRTCSFNSAFGESPDEDESYIIITMREGSILSGTELIEIVRVINRYCSEE